MASINEKLNQSVVGIAGLGGLGSMVAAALCRAGVSRLIIADFDKVDVSNLARQQYFAEQIGRDKVAATIENLWRINPNVKVTGFQGKLDPKNVLDIFAEADIIAECFDQACEKQMIVETVLSKMNTQVIVSVSGLSGYGRSNEIQTRRISDRLILVGDGTSGIESGQVLTAGRVGIAACHQANAIIEIIVDEIKR